MRVEQLRLVNRPLIGPGTSECVVMLNVSTTRHVLGGLCGPWIMCIPLFGIYSYLYQLVHWINSLPAIYLKHVAFATITELPLD